MTDQLSIDTSNKITVNGVDLLNREELSPSQKRELQRYIDANAHLLHYKDRQREQVFPYADDNNDSSLRHNQFASQNADSLKRKGVSWSDLVRAGGEAVPIRSSPYFPYNTGQMNDNYNRFETQSHASQRAAKAIETEASKFQGYGDRPGSGVELTGHHWQGGEVLSSPAQLPKSLKPRRIYYSPIGDGVVAADGVELKRKPVDLNPRVTVTQLTHVDRGQPGQDGLNEYIKTWANSGSAPASEHNYTDFGRGLRSPENNNKDTYGSLRRHSPFDNKTGAASSMFSDPGYRYTDIKHGYAITNPRELIHQYATTTPVACIDSVDNVPGSHTTATYKKKVTTRIEEREGSNYPPYRSSSTNVNSSTYITPPSKFVRQLRDETLTGSQKEANTHVDTLNNRDPNQQERVQEIRSKTTNTRGHDEIDTLTDKLMQGLR